MAFGRFYRGKGPDRIPGWLIVGILVLGAIVFVLNFVVKD